MSDGRILLQTLILAVAALVITFALLFTYVDMQWLANGTGVVNSMRTVIATGAMIVLGVVVYVARRKNN